MKRLKLTAVGPEMERLKAYLEENASDELAEKIENGTPYEQDGVQLINRKDLPDCMAYITKQAEEMAKKKQKTGAVALCVDGAVIIEWLMHYFEEDDIVGVLYNLDGTQYKPAPKAIPKPTIPTAIPTYTPPTKPASPQQSMFDLFDMTSKHEAEETCGTADEQHEEEPVEEDTPIEEEAIDEPAPVVEQPMPEKKPVSGLYTQYLDYKDSYPDTIIAMRIGDFYEVLGDDAVDIAKRLDLTLTSRDVGLESRMPLVGFPYHAAENYFNKIATFKPVVVIECDGEVRGYPIPQEEAEPETPHAPKAKFDDEGFFQLLRILDKVEVK